MGYRDANRISLSGFLVILLASARAAFCGSVIYVDADAPCGNGGLCWPDAYKYLQDALAEASSAQKPIEIRVAGGVYRPDESVAEPNGTGDRDATFQLISGVTIVGGYAGSGEADPNARDLVAYETILSGDLDANDLPLEDFESIGAFVYDSNRFDNSHTVVTGSGTDGTAVLDGFTITGGYANCSTVIGDARGNGGGMYNESGSPTLVNCTFKSNISVSVWFLGCEQPPSGHTECGHLPTATGGAVYNSNSNPTLMDCRIVENVVYSGDVSCAGAGMFNINSNPVLTRCEFSENVATGFDSEYYGAGMYNLSSSPTLTDCSFIANVSANSAIGGMYNACKSNPTLTRCRFEGNISGAMNVRDKATLFDCDFINNEEGALGISYYAKATVNNCRFIGNSGSQYGGAVSVWGSARSILTGCTFIGNSATYGGAVCTKYSGNAVVLGCVFLGNSASYGGGAIYSNKSNPTIINCVFSGNSAGSYKGGGIYCKLSNPILTNCSFAGNSGTAGNGLFLNDSSSLTATNCILRNGGDEVGTENGSTVIMTYSNVEGGWPGAGNTDADPLFEDADGPDEVVGTEDDDLQPAPGSPCINSGDNSAVPPFANKDVAGRVRIMDGVVDMGAHEMQAHIYVNVATGDDLNDGLTPETAFATIQAGINSALTGYTVLVYPGVYNEGINFHGKAITVRGAEDAPILETSVDYGVKFFSAEGPESVLRNFVIRNSIVGIFTKPGAPTIRNVTVVGNNYGVSAQGGLVPDISNCIIWDNIVDLLGCDARHSWVRGYVEQQPADMICHWKFDEGQGGSAHDAVGENHLWVQYPEWTSGVIGGALNFGGDDYAEVDDHPSQQIYTDEITVSVWINLNEDIGNDEARIITKEYDQANSWWLSVYGAGYSGSTGNQIVFHDSDGSSQWYDCMSETNLNSNQWYHVCVTDYGGSIRIYLNGELDWSSDEGYGIPSVISAPIWVGRFDYRAYLDGSIDDLRVYDRALEAREIADLYENGLWGYGSLADPLFADPANGDYHLRSERGRYWPEHDLWVLDAVTSPCIDSGDPNADASAERKPNGGKINMGAYGGTPYASMSECWSRADYNCDGVVNMKDFAHVADNWLQGAEWIE
ncbi:MAG: LamG-like jellyroll fold domain-containing protein [Planctomycetota bacterium]|jgi:predicted outer membrane repeat protein